MKNGSEIIKQIIDDLPKAEKKAARYIIENTSKLKDMNISQLAEASGSSTAAIVRLCKRLEFDGFQQMKLSVIINSINSSTPEKTSFDDFRIQKGVNVHDIMESSIEKVTGAINLIPKIINEESIKDAAELISKSKRIQIMGMGASGLVAMDLMQKLQRIGISAYYYPDIDLQLTMACNLGKEDLFIGISYSGKNKNVIKALHQAREKGARSITLTRFGNNKLSDIGDIKLFVPAVEPLIREAATISRITQLFIIDILFSYIISINPDDIRKNLEETWNIIHR